MQRCKTICHMYMSIDGKIQNNFNNSDCDFAGDIYENLNYTYGEAIIVGRATVDDGNRPDLSKYIGTNTDYADNIQKDNCSYGVIFDPKGVLCHDDKYQNIPNLPKRRILKVLTKKATPEYLAYLKDLDIAYMVCGEDEIDLNTVLTKLKNDYDVKTAVVGGGAMFNGSFFAKDLVDEISLVVAPGVNGSRHGLGFADSDMSQMPKYYKFEKVEILGNNTIILRYKK